MTGHKRRKRRLRMHRKLRLAYRFSAPRGPEGLKGLEGLKKPRGLEGLKGPTRFWTRR